MNSYFIESFKITKLWGYRDIDLNFNKDVNILIGPNASGKTTILNLLHSILTFDLRSVLDVNFDQAVIKLRSFKGRFERTIKVDAANMKLSIGRQKIDINLIPIPDRRFPGSYMSLEEANMISGAAIRGAFRERIRLQELYKKVHKELKELAALVPIVWLPVSRRLPVTEDEEERYTRTDPIESVDSRLDELLDGLSDYHSGLNAQLSKRYKEFEQQVLSVILYSKDDDQLEWLPASVLTEAEKDQLMRAFEAAGLLNEQMQKRIDEHFAAAKDALERRRESENVDLALKDIFVLPLIGRTQAMVKYADELEKDRERIFASLQLYEETVNSFLNEKSVKVDDSGKLKIESSSLSELNLPELNPRLLSSGEKQILILLSQALLRVDDPVVYIADEPELSLHVSWQEKLLESLVKLGGQIQVIVATHSPDIVGKFMDNVVDLGRKN